MEALAWWLLECGEFSRRGVEGAVRTASSGTSLRLRTLLIYPDRGLRGAVVGVVVGGSGEALKDEEIDLQ